MSKNRRTSAAPAVRLQLDAIYDSPDPDVKKFMMQAMDEEYARADERVSYRVAKQFAHLLPPRQQQLVQHMSLAI